MSGRGGRDDATVVDDVATNQLHMFSNPMMQLVQAIAAQRNSPPSCDIYYESGITAAGTTTIDASKSKRRRKKADPILSCDPGRQQRRHSWLIRCHLGRGEGSKHVPGGPSPFCLLSCPGMRAALCDSNGRQEELRVALRPLAGLP